MEKVKRKSTFCVDTKCDEWYTWGQKGGGALNREKVAEKLIKLRGKRSQEEVATAVGISKSALSMYENGERIPRDEIKIRLAIYYNESVESIFFWKRMPRNVEVKVGEKG